MLEGGDAPEGLTRRIISRRPALGEDVDLHQPIGHAFSASASRAIRT
jgi:hypothetical protein